MTSALDGFDRPPTSRIEIDLGAAWRPRSAGRGDRTSRAFIFPFAAWRLLRRYVASAMERRSFWKTPGTHTNRSGTLKPDGDLQGPYEKSTACTNMLRPRGTNRQVLICTGRTARAARFPVPPGGIEMPCTEHMQRKVPLSPDSRFKDLACVTADLTLLGRVLADGHGLAPGNW